MLSNKQHGPNLFVLLTALILAVGPGSNAKAAITGTSGTVVFESSPFPLEADGQVFVFDEQQGVPFVGTQPLDFGSIPPGTLVNSHYIQYDPISYPGFVGMGSVTFDGPIIGVITTSVNLYTNLSPEVSGTSDTYFGLESFLGTYPTGDHPSDRGLGSPEDDLIFEIGENTLIVESLDIPVTGNIDCIRVITLAPIIEEVVIDIKPGGYPNSFNINGSGVIPVAILGSAEFDVYNIDPTTVSLAGLAVAVRGKDKLLVAYEDIIGLNDGTPDGYIDLVIKFEDDTSMWVPGDDVADLIGNLYDGTPIYGWDYIKIVP
jgi:hypothetical protein